MIALILVLLLSALLGAGGLLLLGSKLLAVAGAALPVFVYLVVLGVRRLRARRKAKRIQSVLGGQAEPAADARRPDAQAGISAMRAEFDKAVQALKSSKLARGSRDPLSVLPWYLVIGPQGSGKSTALRNSGMKFPYLSARGARAGGTRHCDWWLTNDAVMLDTAGRYMSGEEEQAEWFAFLDLLVKSRPRRPVNGLVVAVSVSDLLAVDHQAAGEMGQKLRERVDEITARLGVLVPIYILITKCDQLPGFVEMFSDLPRSERGQIWGFTVPMTAQPEAATDLLLERFDELTAVLEQRALRRVGEERRLEARERIHQFPFKFHALRKNLSELVQPLFLGNVFQDTPIMRGLYFGSGTQDMRPADRAASALAEPANGARPAQEPPAEGRSFFLWDVFTKVMFPDQEMAVRSSMEEQRHRRRQYQAAVVGLAAATLAMVLPLVSYVRNRELVLSTGQAITSLEFEHESPISLVQKLDPLAQRLQVLLAYEKSGAPLTMQLGLYRGNQLLPVVDQFYDGALRDVLLGQHQARLEQDLVAFANSNRDRSEWTAENYSAYFDKLKLYLLLTRPVAENQPALETQRKWLIDQMVAHWMRVRGAGGDPDMERIVRNHATVYITRLARNPDKLAFPRQDAVVRSARRVLTNIPLAELKLQQLIANAESEFSDLTLRLRDIVGPVPQMSAARTVRPAFTYHVWDKMIRGQLSAAFKDQESWVLSPDSSQDAKQVQYELRAKYHRAYIREWNDFLDSIRVRPPTDLTETLDLLGYLNRKPSPVEKLFEAVRYNVDLEKQEAAANAAQAVPNPVTAILPAALNKADKVVASLEPTNVLGARAVTGEQMLGARDVLGAFRGLLRFTRPAATADKEEVVVPLKVYQEQLGFVQNDLLDLKDKPKEAAAILEKLRTARRKVQLLIDSQEVGTHALLERLLLPPLNDVHQLVFTGVVDDKSKQWCSDVVAPYAQMVAHRYPFAKDGADVPLSDFADFFQPEQGTVAKFQRTQLQDDVVPSGRRWKFTTEANLYKDELLTFLERSGAVSAAVFPDTKLLEPKARFSVRIHGDPAIASSLLSLDGTEIRYENGPDSEWSKPLEWPGPGKLGAILRVEGVEAGQRDEIVGPGEWGLFRLMEHAQMVGMEIKEKRYFTLTWEVLRGAKISIDFRPERSVNPFVDISRPDAKLFQVFRDPHLTPPAGIARDRSGCGEPAPLVGVNPAAGKVPLKQASASANVR